MGPGTLFQGSELTPDRPDRYELTRTEAEWRPVEAGPDPARRGK